MNNTNYKKFFLLLTVCIVTFIVTARYYYPSIFSHGRIWAEEGTDFLSYAYNNGFLAAITYIHKKHLDLIPNISSAIAVLHPRMMWPHIYPAIALLPYIGLFCAYSYSLLRMYNQLIAPYSGTLSIPNWANNTLNAYAHIVACLFGYLIAASPLSWESILNTINSWAIVVAIFAIILPYLSGSYAFWCPLLLASTCFPTVLFIPYIAYRYYSLHTKTTLKMLCGMVVGSSFQAYLAFFAPDSISLSLMNERSITTNDAFSAPILIMCRAIPNILGINNPYSAFGLLAEKLNWCINYSLMGSIIVAAAFYILNAVIKTQRHRLTLGRNHRKSTADSESKVSNYSTVLIDLRTSSVAIISWQFSALLLSLNGAYNIFIEGGNQRYFYSLYCVYLFVASAITLSAFSYLLQRYTISGWTNSLKALSIIIITVMTLLLILQIESTYNAEYDASKDDFCFYSRPTIPAHNNINNLDLCPRGWNVSL